MSNNIIEIEHFNINPFIEARMLYRSLFKKDDIENFSNIGLLRNFNVENSEDLLSEVISLLEQRNVDIDQWLIDAHNRNEFDTKSQMYFENSKGFPVHVGLLTSMINKGFDICDLAAMEANKVLPNSVYIDGKTRRFKINKQTIAEYLNVNVDSIEIYKLVSGWKNDPILSSHYKLYHTDQTLLGKTGSSLKNLVCDGYIQGGHKTFGTVTGRNSQQLTEGFILQAHPWFRSIIKPKPGKAFIKFDWVAQEPWIAAVMTSDTKLLEGYKSGDLYSAVGKAIDLMPIEANKITHPEERLIAKLLQLGISYGEGEKSLSGKINGAKEYLEKHKQQFSTYWEWVETTIKYSFDKGYYKGKDGWLYFLFIDTPHHLMKNAPFQIEAGGLLRKAVMLLPEEIDLVATHHDALYVNCDIKQKEQVIDIVTSTMNTAAKQYFNVNSAPFIDYEIFEKCHYVDKRGKDFFDKVQNIILNKTYN
jgi:hypothetical protein